MNAYKCDRCGKLYEKEARSILYVKRITTGNGQWQDLCPECTKSLDKWWKAGKEQKNDT